MSVAVARQAPYPVRMQQRRCGKCGKLVSRSAYACRRCGKSQRMRPKTMLLLAAAGAIGAMFAVATLNTSGMGRAAEASGLNPSLVATAPPAGASTDKTPSITASALWSAYTTNRAAAELTYRDCSLVVSGTIRLVDRNFEGDMVVRLATPDALESVNATLASRNDPGLSGLAKGQMIPLLCVGRTGPLMGAPLLGSCFIR